MRVEPEVGVEEVLADGFEGTLREALAGDSFSDVCFIRKYRGFPLVLLECPDTPRYVEADSRDQSLEALTRIRMELHSAVNDGLARIARGADPRGEARTANRRP
jgi:hypothetical protein